MNPLVFASLRVGLFLVLVWMWRQVVELLISNEFIHAMRRRTAIAFRWRFLVLVVALELLVIQQVPTVILDALNI